jgi:hypothetical protein
MLEKKLQEELNRYKAINKYGKTMIMEQDVPPPPPAPDAAVDAPPAPDAAMDVPPTDVPPMDTPDMDTPDMGGMDMGGDNTEEVDITDLVNMTKSIKKDLENRTQDNTQTLTKMDDVFTKLGDLESKLAQMDQVMAKIDQLGAQVEQMKPDSPVEKLEMRSLDSYPFNEKPQEFFSHKQGEMRASGKNEYILTKDDVDNYSPEIKTSFNPEENTDEYRY